MKRLAFLAATLLLAGCGGSLYIGWGDWDDGAPSVSITTAQTSVVAGGVLYVVAAASHDSGIDEVAFYRVDGSVAYAAGQQRQRALRVERPGARRRPHRHHRVPGHIDIQQD